MEKVLSHLGQVVPGRHGRRLWLVFALLACAWLTPAATKAASFTASLDRDSITLGETAILSLTFVGGQPQSVPAAPDIPNLQIAYVGPASEFSFINGQVSSKVTHKFTVVPRQLGDYTIPAFTTQVGGETLSTQPLTLKVLKPSAPSPAAVNSGAQAAFLKLVLPKKELYVGETITAQLQLYLHSRVQGVNQFRLTAFPAEGFNVGQNMVEDPQRRQAQVGNAIYTVISLYFPVKVVKAGPLVLGPVTASVIVEVPSASRQRDPLFEQFGMRSMFNRFNSEQKQLALATEPENVQSLPLPRENVPASFNGAIGNYTLALTAGPTNVATGDPVTLKIQIAGSGSLDSLTLPEQPGWKDFKVYPPTSKVNPTDQLGLQGAKTFEQIVVPQTTEIKELPSVAFSFFNPERKTYHTLTQPPIPLLVRPGGSAPAPTILAANRPGQDNAPPAQNIVEIKQRLGSVAQIGPPLALQSWFLALQSVPVLAFVSALVWRKRAEALANNPRLRRRRQVEQLIRDGISDLRQFAKENKSDEFFATLAHLLQEQLGERLDLPASAITEAVIEERLRPRGVPETTLAPLQELFQTCNLARYAPVQTSQQLAALIPKLEAVLRELQEVKL